MAESTLLQLLTNGGIPAMFALLLVYTLHSNARREDRLMAQTEKQSQREDKMLAKLEELAQTIARISTQLDSLSREIERMQGDHR